MRKEKKEGFFSKKNMISLFIIAVMVLSTAGFILMESASNTSDSTHYKGFSFQRQGNYWLVNIGSQEIEFDYNPYDIESINISKDIIDLLSNTPEIDTTYDFNGSYKQGAALAQYRMNQNLKAKNIYVRVGAAEENIYNLSIITCKDSTPNIPVVFFKESNETKVYKEGSCIIAEANSDIDFIRVGNRLAYSILGVV